MIAISTRMSAIDATSMASSERAAVRISREAIQPITAQPASAIGNHGACGAMPVLLRNAWPKIAMAEMETAGKTR